MKKRWRTRTSGTTRQKGKKFQLPTSSRQGMAHNLPKVNVIHQPRVTRLELINVRTDDLVAGEKEPVNLKARADYFVDMYNRGLTIAPILVHRLPSGKYEILDGHARVEAYRQLGVKQIPAVDNSILESIGKGFKSAVQTGKYLYKEVARPIAREAIRTGREAGRLAEEGLTQAGRISRAYKGEVSPRERFERMAQVRAARGSPTKASVKRTYYYQKHPIHVPEAVKQKLKWSERAKQKEAESQ